MSKISIDVHDVTTYLGTKTPTVARLYCDKKFIASTGQSVIAGVLDSRNFCREAAVSIDGDGKIRLGAFEDDNAVDSTTDGLDTQSSTYTLALYAGNTRLAVLFENLKIYPTPGNQSWTDIQLNSLLPIFNTNLVEVITLARFYQLLNDLSPASRATSVITGITRLSVAPEDLSDPVAVGDNDPRLTLSSSFLIPLMATGGGDFSYIE